MKQNIALIGMMGTYKSTVGKLLADKLQMFFLDCDELLTHELAMSINEMFSSYGEEYFRKQESKLISCVSSYENVLISTGGGVILNPKNMECLRDYCYIIALNSSADSIYKRLKNSSTRPLLQPMSKKRIKQLLYERTPHYEKWADTVIDTYRLTPKAIANKIIMWLEKL